MEKKIIDIERLSKIEKKASPMMSLTVGSELIIAVTSSMDGNSGAGWPSLGDTETRERMWQT